MAEEHSELEDADSAASADSAAVPRFANRRRGLPCSEEQVESNPINDVVPHAACQEAHYPYEIICLIEGYATNKGPGKQLATGSSTLVKGPMNVIVDTGNPSEKDKLLRALHEKGNLSPSDIHFVVCTHGHSDHVGNLNLFPDAKFIVSYDVSSKDHYSYHPFEDGTPMRIDDGVEIIPTPGHTNNDVSVIVQNTRLGVVAITGDLFEKKEDLEQSDLWTRYSENEEFQRRSREKILRIADFIVPGHGGKFRNPRK